MFVAIAKKLRRQNEFLFYCWCVHDYHEYLTVWQAALGEKLKCVWEVGNHSDVFAVAVVRAGETVRYPAFVSQASLARETNPTFALCSCKRRRKSMWGNWLETASPGKVMYSSCYTVLCCSFPYQDLLLWHCEFSISGFTFSFAKQIVYESSSLLSGTSGSGGSLLTFQNWHLQSASRLR